MKRHPACLCTTFGWVETGDDKAYRYFPNDSFDKILNTEFFQNKIDDYWIGVTKVDKLPEDAPILNKTRQIYAYEIEYIQHITRATEFTPQQIIDSTNLLFDIFIYCLENSMWCNTNMSNIVLKNGKPILIDIGDFSQRNPNPAEIRSSIRCVFTTPLDVLDNLIGNINEIGDKFDVILNNGMTLIDKFKAAKNELKNCKLTNKFDNWSNYSIKIPNDILTVKNLFNEKSKVICDIIDNKKPKTMTDLGCNGGIFSFYANRIYGTNTIGVDYCTASIDFANKYSRENGFTSSFVYYDILNPPKAYGINDAFETVYQRYQSDGVIAPALIHHLYKQNNSITKILDIISSYAREWMLIEFIPHNCAHIKAIPNNWYNTNEFENHLTSLGFSFKIFDSYPSPRTWYYCEKKNNK